MEILFSVSYLIISSIFLWLVIPNFSLIEWFFFFFFTYCQDRPFQCTHCPSTFAFQDGLQRYVQYWTCLGLPNRFPLVKTKIDNSYLTSDYCFIVPIRHIQMVHLSERPHLCTICGKAFKQKAHLEKHVSSVHEKRRPCECPVPGCNAAFRENYNLKQVCHSCALNTWMGRCRFRNSNARMLSYHPSCPVYTASINALCTIWTCEISCCSHSCQVSFEILEKSSILTFLIFSSRVCLCKICSAVCGWVEPWADSSRLSVAQEPGSQVGISCLHCVSTTTCMLASGKQSSILCS